MLTEFEQLVLEMRRNQKGFFTWHDQDYLKKSKELERKVDAYLEKKQEAERRDPTPDMFGNAAQ